MTSTPPGIGQPTREASTGREDRGQRGNKWWTLVAVCLGTFMLLLDITIVTVALPDIQRALHSSFADLQWVVYGLIESNQRSFTDGLVLGCLVAAAVLLAVFVIVERRSAHPMFDLKLLRLPTFSGGSVAAFGLSASIFSVLLYLVLYLQDILGYSPLGAGVRVMYPRP